MSEALLNPHAVQSLIISLHPQDGLIWSYYCKRKFGFLCILTKCVQSHRPVCSSYKLLRYLQDCIQQLLKKELLPISDGNLAPQGFIPASDRNRETSFSILRFLCLLSVHVTRLTSAAVSGQPAWCNTTVLRYWETLTHLCHTLRWDSYHWHSWLLWRDKGHC